MSGVCGVVNPAGSPVEPALVKSMAEASAYRGPHGIHCSIRDHVGLAQLASRATQERQPLESADGELCNTADARIDDRGELIALF